eukprot:CAMPEP_0197544642 /NCGR_PEP_ID=MMETSP1318-20131121/68875_1 /TAXON_ID=552666 /ORGANISM="Partenskyella glossopodia, Strain RCC365" /LENGTH=395 /DNA_ID=CAMNT_0043104049 /DNA_START=918 /DNA_END=2105 /DNA_ORIENTATION=+
MKESGIYLSGVEWAVSDAMAESYSSMLGGEAMRDASDLAYSISKKLVLTQINAAGRNPGFDDKIPGLPNPIHLWEISDDPWKLQLLSVRAVTKQSRDSPDSTHTDLTVGLDALYGVEFCRRFSWVEAAGITGNSARNGLVLLSDKVVAIANWSYTQSRQSLGVLWNARDGKSRLLPANTTVPEAINRAQDKVKYFLKPPIELLSWGAYRAKNITSELVRSKSVKDVLKATANTSIKFAQSAIPYASGASRLALEAAKKAAARGIRSVGGKDAEVVFQKACDATKDAICDTVRQAKHRAGVAKFLIKRAKKSLKLAFYTGRGVYRTARITSKALWRATGSIRSVCSVGLRVIGWTCRGIREIWKRTGDVKQARKDLDFALWCMGLGYKDDPDSSSS